LGGFLEVVKYLAKQQKVNTEATDTDGWTALHCACNKGGINIVTYLLKEQHVEKDVLINLTDQSPLHGAIVSIKVISMSSSTWSKNMPIISLRLIQNSELQSILLLTGFTSKMSGTSLTNVKLTPF
jgi:ankyrin repeat protein